MVQFGIDKSFNNRPPKARTTVHKTKGFGYGGNWNKQQSKKRLCLNKFVEFCKRTDLHGYKFIVMEDLNYFERCCWALAVIISIAIAAYFVVTAYKWYARNPIVTVIESTQGAIWDVPFPAVTICNLNMVSRKAAKMFANNLTLPDDVTADFVFNTLRLVPLLYSVTPAGAEEKEHLFKLQTILDFNNITIESLFHRLSPASSCTNLVQRCMWKNAIYRCDEIFKPVFTLVSLCCTFNYYAIEDKTSDESSYTAGPRRVASCGYQTALTVLLYTDPDDYYSSTVASQGALVIIDNAYNIPDLDSPVRIVNPSTELLISLSPERTYSTSGIKAFTPEQRQCYYDDEVRIGKFRQYSFHNCMAYHKAELLMKACRCIPLSFPSEGPYSTCNFKDMSCIEQALIDADQHGNTSEQRNNFKCFPECEHYDYPLEVAMGRLAENAYVNGLPFFDDVDLKNRSLLNVFFSDLVSTRYRRDIYLNWQNILAAFGGLLSLMLGFTLVSGFDLILFFTLRTTLDLFTVPIEGCDNKRNKIYVQEHRNKLTRMHKPKPNVFNKKVVKKYKDDYLEHRKY